MITSEKWSPVIVAPANPNLQPILGRILPRENLESALAGIALFTAIPSAKVSDSFGAETNGPINISAAKKNGGTKTGTVQVAEKPMRAAIALNA